MVAGILFVSALVIYLSQQDRIDDNGRWALVGVMIIFAISWVLLTEKKTPVASNQAKPVVKAEAKTEIVEDEPEEEDSNEDGMSLRERKLAKIRSNEEQDSMKQDSAEDDTDDDDSPEVEVTVENLHVAETFVVEVSPQSIEDADIESRLREKNERDKKIRERIEARRRGRMAEIRASTARMWEDYAAGEDLLALLAKKGHGQEVLSEPENVEAGGIYGATFVRVDDSRILKIRTSLTKGFITLSDPIVEKDVPLTLDLPPIPGGMPLPPLPGEQPLPLPPPPAPSSALASLKDEMAVDD
jgi:hypothetical protein